MGFTSFIIGKISSFGARRANTIAKVAKRVEPNAMKVTEKNAIETSKKVSTFKNRFEGIPEEYDPTSPFWIHRYPLC